MRWEEIWDAADLVRTGMRVTVDGHLGIVRAQQTGDT